MIDTKFLLSYNPLILLCELGLLNNVYLLYQTKGIAWLCVFCLTFYLAIESCVESS